ncbi:hypothetical protein Gotur_019307 [Gossypium turneri]
MEILEGAYNHFHISEDGLANKSDFCEEENLFHDAESTNLAVQGGLTDWLVHALELNNGGTNVEVADFHGMMHASEQDYDMLEPISDEYIEEREEIDLNPVKGEYLVRNDVVCREKLLAFDVKAKFLKAVVENQILLESNCSTIHVLGLAFPMLELFLEDVLQKAHYSIKSVFVNLKAIHKEGRKGLKYLHFAGH